MTTLTSILQGFWRWTAPTAQKEVDHLLGIREDINDLQDDILELFNRNKEVDVHYVKVASQAFMERMDKVQTGLEAAIERTNENVTKTSEQATVAFNLVIEDIAKLRTEVLETKAKVELLLRGLRALGSA